MSVDNANLSNDSFSDSSQSSIIWDDIDMKLNKTTQNVKQQTNILRYLVNRQIYGRFTNGPHQKTEKLYENIKYKCKFTLGSLINEYDALGHIFMGFTICGKYFVSLTEKTRFESNAFFTTYEYDLYLWHFIPGQKLRLNRQYRIFKHLQGPEVLDKILFMQFPMDPTKIICYGSAVAHSAMVYLTILTIPTPKSCRHCNNTTLSDSVMNGWCMEHGFILHYMFSLSQPGPEFNPHLSLAYPDHLVINTGHYIHILNVTTTPTTPLLPPATASPALNLDEIKTDTFSEISIESSANSMVDTILDDINSSDQELNDNRPFHELNISCEPLNLGRSYHNTIVQNYVVDPRLKRLNNSLISTTTTTSATTPDNREKLIIDKKNAEKAYEFIEEDVEKYEKLSSFRKKRLAEKKYEFSEDNNENIVPFNSLRKERRYYYHQHRPTQNQIFLSPRSPSANQFSPNGGGRSIRYPPPPPPPITSPRAGSNSESIDYESRFILRFATSGTTNHNDLLIMDTTQKETTPKWIKKVVRRYQNDDYENGSILSGHSRDDYNIPIEIPLLIQTLNEQQQNYDNSTNMKKEEIQLIVTQRTFDLEQFVQRHAEKLCAGASLKFLHCYDYDVRINYVCPLNGHIVCQAMIKLGALKNSEPYGKPLSYTTDCLFTWNIITDQFDVIDGNGTTNELVPSVNYDNELISTFDIPPIHCNGVLVMDYHYTSSKTNLNDYHNLYEICLGTTTLLTTHVRSSYSDYMDYDDDDDDEDDNDSN